MKNIYLIIISAVLVLLLIVGTYSISLAYFGTKVQSENVTPTNFKTGKIDVRIEDNSLNNIVLTPIYDSSYMNSSYKKEIKIISNKDSLNTCSSLYLKINEISNSLKSKYLKYRLIGNGVDIEGNFEDVDNELLLKNNIFLESNNIINYDLYIWVSYDEEVDQINMLNSNLNASLLLKSYDVEKEEFCR